MRKSFSELTVLGTIYFVIYMTVFALLIVIPQLLAFKLGLRSNKHSFKLKRVLTSPEVFLGQYFMPVSSSNVVVIKGKDGKLLLRSPPPALPHIVARIREEGEPGVILVTTSHDTFFEKWKELFPQAVVIAQKKDIPVIGNRVKVDIALEDAANVLRNYFVTNWKSTGEALWLEDAVLFIDMPDNRVAASLPCGFGYFPVSLTDPFFWQKLILAGNGFNFRVSGFTIMKSHRDLCKFWAEVVKTTGLIALLPLHGEELVTVDLPRILASTTPLPEYKLLPLRRSPASGK